MIRGGQRRCQTGQQDGEQRQAQSLFRATVDADVRSGPGGSVTENACNAMEWTGMEWDPTRSND